MGSRYLTYFVTHRKPLSLTLAACYLVAVHADLGGGESLRQAHPPIPLLITALALGA